MYTGVWYVVFVHCVVWYVMYVYICMTCSMLCLYTCVVCCVLCVYMCDKLCVICIHVWYVVCYMCVVWCVLCVRVLICCVLHGCECVVCWHTCGHMCVPPCGDLKLTLSLSIACFLKKTILLDICPHDPYLWLLSTGITDRHQYLHNLHVGAGIWTRVFMPVRQMLYSLSYLPGSHSPVLRVLSKCIHLSINVSKSASSDHQ